MRLGFNQVKGLPQESLDKLVESRGEGYSSVDDLVRRSGLDRKSLERLAEADAFRSLGLDRRQALWAMKGVEAAAPALFAARRRGDLARRAGAAAGDAFGPTHRRGLSLDRPVA